jgi:hypothetical protein
MPAVRTVGDSNDLLIVHAEDSQLLTCFHIPDPYCLIVTARSDLSTIGAEGKRGLLLRSFIFECKNLSAGFRVPDCDIRPCRGDTRAG